MAQTLKKVFDIAVIAAIIVVIAGFAWSAIADEPSQTDRHSGPVTALSQVLASAE